MSTSPNDPLELALQWRDEGQPVALATVLATWGSSPRPAGSQLVVNSRGEFAGSVSAGCVESSVIAKGIEIIEHGRPEVLEMGIDDGMAWEVGLSCGGQLSILVERVEPGAGELDRLLRARRDGQPVVLATELGTGTRRLFAGDDRALPEDTADPVERTALECLAANRCERTTIDSTALFFHPYRRDPRLVIIGAVHIAEPLIPMARLAGFEVVLVEPRQAFADRPPFAEVPLLRRWPNEAFSELGLDADTAVVALTHDPKIDDVALVLSLQSPAFYVGALGSRRTQERRRQRLHENGLETSQIEALHGPVGLAIGALSPAEIAVSVLAEVIAVRRSQPVDTASRRGSEAAVAAPSKATPT